MREVPASQVAMRVIGRPASRYDGVAKVTGTAVYAAEARAENLAYGVAVSAPIAVGRIVGLDISQAVAVPGVVAVFSHLNCPPLPESDKPYQDQVAPPGSPFRPFQDDRVRFAGQPIALVVAEDFETARYAARLVTADYLPDRPAVDLQAERENSYVPPVARGANSRPPSDRGDADAALQRAVHRIEAEYHSPTEHHNPMEMHATTAVWISPEEILIHEKTQGAHNVQTFVASVFGYAKDKVAVSSPYVGGAFGSALRPQHSLFLAVLACRAMRRPVRVTMTRQQMFWSGHRPETVQTVSLGADGGGKLTALAHEAIAATSRFEDHQENVVRWSEQLYGADNARFGYRLAKLDIPTPCDMRAPGGTLGCFALESAMDELAHASGIDPLELRLLNYSDTDHAAGKPFSTKELRECFRLGAAAIGWERRAAEPRARRDGRELVGLGLATGIWEAHITPAGSRARLTREGRVEIETGMADIGTGTYTVAAQVAAELLGVAMEDVTVRLGDSRLPKSPVEGGSYGAASVTSSVQRACELLKAAIAKRAARLNDAPLAGVGEDELRFEDGALVHADDPARRMTLAEVMRNEAAPLEVETDNKPAMLEAAMQTVGLTRRSHFTHMAVFAEVGVDDELGLVRVKRVVAAIDAGRILNPKTARSQIVGGVVWGIGMALQEESMMDRFYGRWMNHNYAEYHVPVNADIRDIDVIFVETPDTDLNRLGVKGLGEIGIVGTAAAVANAVFDATGRRVRKLPVTLDKLL